MDISKNRTILLISTLCVVGIAIIVLRISASNTEMKVSTTEKQQIEIEKLDNQGKRPALCTYANKNKTSAKILTSKDKDTQPQTIDFDDHLQTLADTMSNYSSPIRSGYFSGNLAFWRRNEAGLDNIYSEREVANIRNLYTEKYLDKLESAPKQQDWRLREALQTVARKQLKKGIAHLEKLYQASGDTTVKGECLLAITELQYRTGDYQQAIDFGKKTIDHVIKPRLVSQAYYYLIRSYAMACDINNSQKYIDLLFKEFPNEANRLYGNEKYATGDFSEYEALLRKQAHLYNCAEEFGDLILKDPANAKMFREFRDTSIEFGKDCEDKFLGLLDVLEEDPFFQQSE